MHGQQSATHPGPPLFRSSFCSLGVPTRQFHSLRFVDCYRNLAWTRPVAIPATVIGLAGIGRRTIVGFDHRVLLERVCYRCRADSQKRQSQNDEEEKRLRLAKVSFHYGRCLDSCPADGQERDACPEKEEARSECEPTGCRQRTDAGPSLFQAFRVVTASATVRVSGSLSCALNGLRVTCASTHRGWPQRGLWPPRCWGSASTPRPPWQHEGATNRSRCPAPAHPVSWRPEGERNPTPVVLRRLAKSEQSACLRKSEARAIGLGSSSKRGLVQDRARLCRPTTRGRL